VALETLKEGWDLMLSKHAIASLLENYLPNL